MHYFNQSSSTQFLLVYAHFIQATQCSLSVFFPLHQDCHLEALSNSTFKAFEGDALQRICHSSPTACPFTIHFFRATLRSLSRSSCHFANSSIVKPKPTPPSWLSKAMPSIGLITRQSGHRTKHASCTQKSVRLQHTHAHGM